MIKPDRPSSIFRPGLTRSGDRFYADYGTREGVNSVAIRGVGRTPDLAMADFDRQWTMLPDGSDLTAEREHRDTDQEWLDQFPDGRVSMAVFIARFGEAAWFAVPGKYRNRENGRDYVESEVVEDRMWLPRTPPVTSGPIPEAAIIEAEKKQEAELQEKLQNMTDTEWLDAQGTHINGVEFARRFGYEVWRHIAVNDKYQDPRGRQVINRDTADRALVESDKAAPDEEWLGDAEFVDVGPFVGRFGYAAWLAVPKKHRSYRGDGTAYVERQAILDRVWEDE